MEKKSFRKNDNEKKIDWRNIVIALVIIYAIVVTCIVCYIKFNKTDNNVNENVVEEIESEEQSLISTYTYEHEVLYDDKAKEARGIIRDELKYLKEHNVYLEVQISDYEYNTYIYNKDNEVFAQSSDGKNTAIYFPDDKSVKFDAEQGVLAYGTDIDFLDILERAVKSSERNVEGVKLLEMTLKYDEEDTEDHSNDHEYRIDMVGEKAIRSIYEDIGSDYADSILNSLYNDLGDEWEPHLIYCLSIDNRNFTAYCYIVLDNEEYLNWISDGYIELNDWKLNEDWYNVEFGVTDDEQVYNLVDDTIETVAELIEQYASENDIEIDKIDAEDYINSNTENENNIEIDNE